MIEIASFWKGRILNTDRPLSQSRSSKVFTDSNIVLLHGVLSKKCRVYWEHVYTKVQMQNVQQKISKMYRKPIKMCNMSIPVIEICNLIFLLITILFQRVEFSFRYFYFSCDWITFNGIDLIQSKSVMECNLCEVPEIWSTSAWQIKMYGTSWIFYLPICWHYYRFAWKTFFFNVTLFLSEILIGCKVMLIIFIKRHIR